MAEMFDPPSSFQVVVLSGPSGSGAGKTTVVERLIREAPVKLVKCVSATTRPPRTGEIEGDAYYFLSPEDFAARRTRNEFLETAEVFGAGYWYGTLRSEIERARHADGWAFLEIDVQGALPRVVRAMFTVETELSSAEISHIYLGGAKALRRDIAQ